MGTSKAAKRAYWYEVVTDWASSGLSKAEYARQHGLAAYQLTQWAARYPHWVDAQSTGDSESGGDPAATFVTFQASEGVDHAGAGASPLVLTLAGGQRLEIRPGFCATTLERVMAALGS